MNATVRIGIGAQPYRSLPCAPRYCMCGNKLDIGKILGIKRMMVQGPGRKKEGVVLTGPSWAPTSSNFHPTSSPLTCALLRFPLLVSLVWFHCLLWDFSLGKSSIAFREFIPESLWRLKRWVQDKHLRPRRAWASANIPKPLLITWGQIEAFCFIASFPLIHLKVAYTRAAKKHRFRSGCGQKA